MEIYTGAETLMCAMVIIETGKLNGIDPQDYLTNVLDRMHDYKINHLDELLLWKWKAHASGTDSQPV